MQGFYYYLLKRFSFWLCAAMVMACWIAAAPIAPALGASQSEPKGQEQEEQPIQITANQLINDNEQKYAEFIGAVKAVQGDFVMTSDRLRIYYAGDLMNPKEEASDEERLKKITAFGNVRIITQQYEAEAEQVDYDVQTTEIVLIGENSKVISGKNSVTGSKIILNRRDGRFKVEGGQKKRVKAVFYSKGSISDTFKEDSDKKKQ